MKYKEIHPVYKRSFEHSTLHTPNESKNIDGIFTVYQQSFSHMYTIKL
jgi:hypothetical protein